MLSPAWTLVEELAEHLNTGAGGLRGVLDADDLDLVAGVDGALLDLAGHHGATAGDREDVLDRHEEGLVEVALGGRDVLVDLRHELHDLAGEVSVALKGLQRRDVHDRGVVTREVVLVEELAPSISTSSRAPRRRPCRPC